MEVFNSRHRDLDLIRYAVGRHVWILNSESGIRKGILAKNRRKSSKGHLNYLRKEIMKTVV